MDAIYEKLLEKLAGSYQFLHQKAKGKLVIAQMQHKSRKISDVKESLQEAVYNITRAQELAKQYPNAKNIDETLLHMAYTTGRIYIQLKSKLQIQISSILDGNGFTEMFKQSRIILLTFRHICHFYLLSSALVGC